MRSYHVAYFYPFLKYMIDEKYITTRTTVNENTTQLQMIALFQKCIRAICMKDNNPTFTARCERSNEYANVTYHLAVTYGGRRFLSDETKERITDYITNSVPPNVFTLNGRDPSCLDPNTTRSSIYISFNLDNCLEYLLDIVKLTIFLNQTWKNNAQPSNI